MASRWRAVAWRWRKQSSTLAEEAGGEWPEWSEVWDPASEAYYYYNNHTGETSWDKPEGFASPEASAGGGGGDFKSLYPPHLRAALLIQGVIRAKKARIQIRLQRATLRRSARQSLRAKMATVDLMYKIPEILATFDKMFKLKVYQNLEGSFSAFLDPIFHSLFSFCSIFQALHDLRIFTLLQVQHF